MKVVVLVLCALAAVPAVARANPDLVEGSRLMQRVNELHKAQKFAEAVPLARRAVVLYEGVHGKEHADVATCLGWLGSSLESAGKPGEAVAIFRRAMAIREQLDPSDLKIGPVAAGLGRVLVAIGKPADAEAPLRRAIGIYETNYGRQSAITASVLSSLVQALVGRGRYADAEPLARRAAAIYETVHGSDHGAVVTTLLGLAEVLILRADQAKAEATASRAHAIAERLYGADHEQVAVTLNSLAVAVEARGAYKEAERMFRRSLAITEASFGPQHTRVAIAVSNLGTMLARRGDLEAGEPLLRRSLAIHQRLSPNGTNVASTLSHLAALRGQRGDPDGAETLYRKALAINERAFGEKHPAAAGGLLNLAQVLLARGDFAAAEPLLRRALAIREAGLGPRHPDVAHALSPLAWMLASKGDLAAAEPLHRRAVEILEASLGPEHPDLAAALNNLGELHKARRKYDKAEPLFRRAVSVLESAHGQNHREVATAIHNLALLLHARGDYAGAAALFRKALRISETVLGAAHSSVGATLNGLAWTLEARGDRARAEPMFRRALILAEKAFGPEHPWVAKTLESLTRLRLAAGDPAAAVAFKKRALNIADRSALRILQTGSLRQKQAFFATLEESTHNAVSLHVQGAPGDAGAMTLAVQTLLRRKGLAAEVGASTLDVLARRAGPADREKLAALRTARSDLARHTLAGPLPGIELDAHRNKLVALRARIDDLERELSARYAELRVERLPVSVDAVKGALPPRAALIEYAVYRPFDPRKPIDQRRGEPRYVAYVVRPGRPVGFADLGPAAPIDRAVARYRQPLARAETSVADAARAVDRLVAQPVRPLVGDAVDLFVAADGALNLAPFSALVDEHGRFLIARFRFNRITSGRDLLRFAGTGEPRSPPLVLGGPDYGPDGEVESGAQRGTRSLDFADIVFPPLAGTLAEVQALGKLLPGARVLTGARATEAAIKQAAAPAILHVATHGFFLSDVDPTFAFDEQRRLRLISKRRPTDSALPENPMLRAGLAFANANQRASGRSDDGILTALEASNLDLRGTRLVVLSACETGLGDVKNGDGVYGLRRALVVAGSRTQVMSLWRVSDDATRELMVHYYRRLKSGAGRLEALRQAQLAMLENPKTQHPYFWSSFIGGGDPTSLDGQPPGPVRAAATPTALAAARSIELRSRRGCGCGTTGSGFGGLAVWMVVGFLLLGSRIRRRQR